MLYLVPNIMASYTMSSKVLQYLQCLLFSITKKMFISVAKINHSEFSSYNIHVQSSFMYPAASFDHLFMSLSKHR